MGPVGKIVSMAGAYEAVESSQPSIADTITQLNSAKQCDKRVRKRRKREDFNKQKGGC